MSAGSDMAHCTGNGCLIIIGGAEEKEGDRVILKEVARRVGDGKLLVAVVASTEPDEMWHDYHRIFSELGVRHISPLQLDTREDALEETAALNDCRGIFFTGGDQLRLTTVLGGTPVCQQIRDLYRSGGLVAGTSAGASVMSETMIVGGSGDESYRIGTDLRMAPGLGLIREIIIDQHFAERGRIGRLAGAVSLNPRQLGIGIDEDTAIVVRENCLKVIGKGSVYVLDALGLRYCNVAEERNDRALTAIGFTLHVLSAGDEMTIADRAVHPRPAPT